MGVCAAIFCCRKPCSQIGGEIMVRLNGVNVSATGRNLKEYLLEQGFLLDQIAVEKNGEIIPKNKLENDVIQDQDQIEVVTFVGGG